MKLIALLASSLVLAVAAEPVSESNAGLADQVSPSPVLPHLGEPAIDHWLSQQAHLSDLTDLSRKGQSDVLRQTYHRRAPTWIQNAAELVVTDFAGEADAQADTIRHLDTLAWLLDDEARRRADDEAAEATARLFGLPLSHPATDPLIGELRRHREVAIVLALGAAALLAVVLLTRRRPASATAKSSPPRKRRRRREPGPGGPTSVAPAASAADFADTVPAPPPGLRRRRRKRRKRGQAPSTTN